MADTSLDGAEGWGGTLRPVPALTWARRAPGWLGSAETCGTAERSGAPAPPGSPSGPALSSPLRRLNTAPSR